MYECFLMISNKYKKKRKEKTQTKCKLNTQCAKHIIYIAKYAKHIRWSPRKQKKKKKIHFTHKNCCHRIFTNCKQQQQIYRWIMWIYCLLYQLYHMVLADEMWRAIVIISGYSTSYLKSLNEIEKPTILISRWCEFHTWYVERFIVLSSPDKKNPCHIVKMNDLKRPVYNNNKKSINLWTVHSKCQKLCEINGILWYEIPNKTLIGTLICNLMRFNYDSFYFEWIFYDIIACNYFRR